MSNGYRIEVYKDLEDNYYLYYEDSIHGADLTGRLLKDGMIAITGYDENDNDIDKETVKLEEFLERVLNK